MATKNYKDVLIIGAGPVGLFTVFECGMLGLNCHIIDSLSDIGGQCTSLYPQKPIYDIPAFPKIMAHDLINRLEKQALAFKPLFHLEHNVIDLARKEDLWHITTHKGLVLTARVILIAAGGGMFGPNKPPIHDIKSYEEKSIFYAVKRPALFKEKKVVIAGGGDSAVDWAVALSKIASQVLVVHRRNKFKAAASTVIKMEKLAAQGKVTLMTGWQLHDLKGKNGFLSHVTLENMTGDKQTVEADYLLPFFGLKAEVDHLRKWGLQLKEGKIVVDPLTQATNLPTVFSIGDICTYPHKLDLILTGFAEAATAAHQARSVIFPNQEFHFEYSTVKGLPT